MANGAPPLQRLYRLIKLEREDITLLIILTLGYGLLSITTPVAVQVLVNLVTMGGVLQPLFVVAIILLALLLLSGIIYLMETYVVELIQRRLFVRSALDVAAQAHGVQLYVYDKQNPIELMNRFFDITTVQKASATLLTIGLTSFLQGVIGSLILMLYSVYFIAAVAVILVCLYMIVYLSHANAESTAIDESKSKYAMMAWLESVARNFGLSKFYQAQMRISQTTDALASEYVDARTAHFRVVFRQHIWVLLMYAVMGTAMLVLGGVLVIQGQINLGQFVAAELIIFGVLTSFVRFVTKLEYFYDMLAALDKLGQLEDLPQEPAGAEQTKLTSFESLQVNALHFAYTPQIKPIEQLSFMLQKGQSLAVLGDSGSGKTTLVELLTGLRSPDTGYIAYNGIDLRQLDLDQFRDRIGFANKVELVAGTLLDNLRMGRSQIRLDEINQILKSLGLFEDFVRFKDGIETPITELGAPLSTTQQQRLMLARAMLGKPDLIIIDRLLDTLSPSEFEPVLSTLKALQQDCMILVTTRFQHVANRFDNQMHLDVTEVLA